jgi:tetratricopeptide (TPR) repeat protein
MKLGFIILAHNQPDAVRRLVDVLAGAGHQVVIHFDTSAPADQQQTVRSLEQAYTGIVRVVSQVHCVWGEWSLVEAVLVALREFERMPEKPDYIHLMSGADFPIRPIADLQEFLRRHPDKDFIECCDVTQRRWVKGGLSMERFRFFFPVNFRTSRKTFDRIVRWHRKLHIRRKIPLGMTPHMGSQWWTLRWSTCAGILEFLRKNPRVISYFRSTWIPDESFFQTVLAHLIPRREIADLQLILHHLTPTGRPYVVYPDHLPLVRKLPHFFVRKVAPSALDGIEALARTRRSPIPRPPQLARVRDRIRAAIDSNYEHHTSVPGHPHGGPPASSPKTALVFLTENQAESELVRAHARAHSAAIWCGRPCKPDAIDLTDAMLAATGLTRDMIAVRATFPDQFADTLAAALPQDKIAVFAFQKGDTADHAALLSRMAGTRFAAIRPHVFYHVLCPDLIREVPARRIRRCLDGLAAKIPNADSPADAPSIETHGFGRIGNYFHLDATFDLEAGTPFHPTFILPGIAGPVRPEAVYTRPDPSGGIRVVLFFWVDDGVFSPISAANPAHMLLHGEASHVPPQPLRDMRESTVDDFMGMLDSFGGPEVWSDRLVLETMASTPVVQRLEFLLRAKPHWPPARTEENLARLIAEDDPSFPLFRNPEIIETRAVTEAPVDEEWEALVLAITEQAVVAPALASQAALNAIQSHDDLPRGEVLRAVYPILPRDSKWWVATLVADPSLGDEQVADALNSIGTAASHQNKADLAELCFTAALRIHPPAQSISWNLGLLLAAEGRHEEAARRFHAIRRHYSNESISTSWPTRDHAAWPSMPWPVDGFSLPEGVTSWPRISIVTPSYNQGHFIEETILSVLHQNYPNLQYIVVDGNSTDDTRAILERYRDRIDHLIIEPDDGQTQAINKGFRLADGEMIAWLNSDDMYGPGTLHQVALHWLHSRADVLAGICAEHRDHSFAVINKPSATNRDFNTAQLARIFPHWFSGMYFFQPEVFFTKALFDRVGPLDESLHYAMDYDLWMRFAKGGAQLEVIDWPCAFFRLHDAQKTTQAIACIAEQCAVRNRHHPLGLREERRHQIERQLAALRAKASPAIAILGPHFEAETNQAAAADPSLVPVVSTADPFLSSADAALILIGSQRLEIPLLHELRTTHPDLLLLGWFLDHDHDPHANHEAALLLDIILPTDSTTGDYLRHDGALMGPAVNQDPLTTLADLWAGGSSH